jgi:hypothetical protein
MMQQLFEFQQCIGKTIQSIDQTLRNNPFDESWTLYILVVFTDKTYIIQRSEKDIYGDNDYWIYLDYRYHYGDLPTFDIVICSPQEIRAHEKYIKDTERLDRADAIALVKLTHTGLCQDIEITPKMRKAYFKKLDKQKKEVVYHE